MKIDVNSTIAYSRDTVFDTYREEIQALVQYLPNIDKIDVVSREEKDGIVTFENHWYASASDIPKVAQAFVKPEMKKWIDRARWNLNDKTCEWEIETFFMKEAVTCSGLNTFSENGSDAMTLRIQGDLGLNVKKVPGVPTLLAGTIRPQLEKFIVAMITPNFETINKGIAQYLASKA